MSTAFSLAAGLSGRLCATLRSCGSPAGLFPITRRLPISARIRITRWEHEHLLEAVQQRLDANPHAMRQRRETVEHPFGTMKARMGATHFLTKTLPKVAGEMALAVLAYNLTRVMNIVGTKSLMAALAA